MEQSFLESYLEIFIKILKDSTFLSNAPLLICPKELTWSIEQV